MRTKSQLIAEALFNSNFQAAVFIPVVEDLVEMEKRSSETNQLLENEKAFLNNERVIAQGEILLSILRLCSSTKNIASS